MCSSNMVRFAFLVIALGTLAIVDIKAEKSFGKWQPVVPGDYPLIRWYLKKLGEEGTIDIKGAWYQGLKFLVDYVEGGKSCKEEFSINSQDTAQPTKIFRSCTTTSHHRELSTIEGSKWKVVPKKDYPKLIGYLEKIDTKGKIVLRPPAYHKQIVGGDEYEAMYSDGVSKRCVTRFDVKNNKITFDVSACFDK